MRSRWLAFAVALIAAACATPPPTPPAGSPLASSVLPPPSPTSTPSPTPGSIPAKLIIGATGLGPCRQPWWSPCIYGIRIEGPGGYDHRGSFDWDPGPPPSGEMGMGTAGPVSSTGVVGDVPATLGAGTWTVSFRLYYGTDVASYNPVPGGTPRPAEQDPFTAACATGVTVDPDVAGIRLSVAFSGAACRVTLTYDGMPKPSTPAG